MSVGESWEDVVGDDVAHEARLQPRRPRDDTEMDITPMIDITFLLLIFFIVASKMNESTNVPLPPAKFGMAVATRNSVIVTIDEGGDDEPAAVYKGDGANPDARIDYPDLETLEQELEDYVADTVLEDAQKRYVLIKAAGGLKHRDVARVTQAVSRVAEIQRLHVAVLEDQ